MNDIISPEHLKIAQQFRKIYSRFSENEDLISVGAYQKGSDPTIDEAIEYYPQMNNFLRQQRGESESLEQSIQGLSILMQNSFTPAVIV